jgi:hypothetical protein
VSALTIEQGTNMADVPARARRKRAIIEPTPEFPPGLKVRCSCCLRRIRKGVRFRHWKRGFDFLTDPHAILCANCVCRAMDVLRGPS